MASEQTRSERTRSVAFCNAGSSAFSAGIFWIDPAINCTNTHGDSLQASIQSVPQRFSFFLLLHFMQLCSQGVCLRIQLKTHGNAAYAFNYEAQMQALVLVIQMRDNLEAALERTSNAPRILSKLRSEARNDV